MNNEARQAILTSIRSHLAASAPYDARELNSEQVWKAGLQHSDLLSSSTDLGLSLVEIFKQNLELVGGHCVIAQGDTEIARALTNIISDLQKTNLRAQRIAISDNPIVERLMHLTDLEIEALAIAPNASDIFSYDVGISTTQAAIAETGTLVLVSADERHRLVSLVPPIHIAIVDASRICETLGEALELLRNGRDLSRAVTFVTGPSRTADIELTLTVGVHGPQELYVIVNGLI
jgi:L-lactate dehydrogenase complex protein LldG